MLYVDIDIREKAFEDNIKCFVMCGETEIVRLYKEFYSFYTRDITFEEIMLYVEQQVERKQGAGVEVEHLEDLTFEII